MIARSFKKLSNTWFLRAITIWKGVDIVWGLRFKISSLLLTPDSRLMTNDSPSLQRLNNFNKVSRHQRCAANQSAVHIRATE